MPATVTAYLFRDGPFAPAGNTVVCVVDRPAVEAALGRGQVETLFGGAAVYTDRAIKVEYKGVWGTRNSSRLRALLRARGVELTISRGPPPGARLRYFTHSRGTKGESRRVARAALQSIMLHKS